MYLKTTVKKQGEDYLRFFTTRRLAVCGMTAAIYATLTILQPYSDTPIQCRLSEVMNLLAFVNPVFAPGIVLGCFVANLFSSVNPLLDSVFGTAHTVCSMALIVKCSKVFKSGKYICGLSADEMNLLIASVWPMAGCVFIGLMFLLAEYIPRTVPSFITATAFVMAGQFLAVTIIGFPLFLWLLRNKRVAAYLINF